MTVEPTQTEAEEAPAADGELAVRSAQFRREREADWRRLEELLARLRQGGKSGLSSEELLELPHLYRATLASLSIARSYVLDSNLVAYLNSLAARAHGAVFASKETFREAMGRLLARDLPRSVRLMLRPILFSGVVLLLGVLFGRALVLERPDLYESLVSDTVAQGRTPFTSTEDLKATIAADVATLADYQAFALNLIENNVTVALVAMGFGLALGIPTALMVFLNGVILGAMIAVFAMHGLKLEMLAWLSIHGTTELTAIVLAGGAGFAIAHAFMFPRPGQSRLKSAAAVGPHVARVAVAVIVMLVVAGFLEAFARSMIADVASRFFVGGLFAALWLFYFARAGRRDPDGVGPSS